MQDALLVIGAELLDLHLASDAASDAEDTEVAVSSPGIGVGAAPSNGTSYPGPAGLRLAKVCSSTLAAQTCHAALNR